MRNPLTGKLVDVQKRVTQAYREAAAASVLINALERIANAAQIDADMDAMIAKQALEAYRQAISRGE